MSYLTRLELITNPAKWMSSLSPDWMVVLAIVVTVALLASLFVGLVAEMTFAQLELSTQNLLNDYLDKDDERE